MPDIQGARLIFSINEPNYKNCFIAACNGFRDIIPSYLDQHDWLQRFQFSTAGNHDETIAPDEAAKSNALEIHLGLPARISWLNRESLWLESKVRPYLDDEFQLSGQLAQDLGDSTLSLKVQSQETRNLVYRFSEAAICSWQHERAIDEEKVRSTLDELKSVDQGVKKKIFLAMQSPALRIALMKYLDSGIYEIHSALQKKSLVNEPKYFTPSLVFIEYRLCAGEGMSRFQDMVAQIPESSTVVLVGARQEDLAQFHNFALGRRIEALFQIPKNLPEIIQSNYLKSHKNSHHKNFHIPRRHPYSFAKIGLKATITGLDGDFLKLKIPMGLANYGLIHLEFSPECEVFAKVVETSTPKERVENEVPHEHQITCRMNCLSEDHRKKILKIIKGN